MFGRGFHSVQIVMLSLAGFVSCSRIPFSNAPENSSTDLAITRVLRPVSPRDHLSESELVERARAVNSTYYWLVGHRWSSLGDSAKAMVAFERVRSLDESSPEVHVALAEEALKLGLSVEGVAYVKKALELDPHHRPARLLLASLYISTKKTFEAIQTFESILAHDPKDEEALLSLIALELESGHKAAAERHLKPFLAQNPDSALGQYYWGRLLQETQRPRDALKAYEKAVDLRPGFVQAGTYLGFLQEELGLRSEALKTFVWLAQETDSTRYHKKLGQLFLDSRDYEKSLEAFSNSLRTDPEDLNTKVRVGLLQLETGRLDPALETFRSILKEAEDNETIRYYLGAVLFEKKRWAEAIPELARIPRESKLWIESLRKRLAAMRQLKQEVEAKKIATEIYASLLPDDAAREEVAEMTSQILSSLGEHKESDALLSEALANHPDSELLLYALAVAREKSGQWESAAQTMQKLIQRNPRHAGALNFVGYLWAEQGVQLPEAEALIRRALSFRQNDPFIMDSLAWVRFRRGAWSEALNLLEKARTLAPDESVIWEHLGDVLAKMGRFPEAKTHYEKALELGPERSSEENKLREKLAQTSREAENMCRVAEKSGQLLDPSCRTVLGLRDASPRQPASADAP